MCSYVVIVRVSLVWILMTDILSRVLLSDFIFLSVDNILVCVCEFLDIPVIPDLEDVQEEDMMTQIAAPPRLLYFLYYSPLVVLILSQGSLLASPQTINTHDCNINSKNLLLWERVILINLWPPKCFQLTGDAFQINHVGSWEEGKARVLEEKPFFFTFILVSSSFWGRHVQSFQMLFPDLIYACDFHELSMACNYFFILLIFYFFLLSVFK